MNTDSCNVEDMNIPHITECSSLSSVASIEDCFCLFRTWSFTLFKNDLDPNDNSDSVSSSSTTNWCARCEQTTGLSVLSSINSSIHQISTLEKTKFYQRSILSSLMSVRIQRVSLFYRTSQLAYSEDFDFRVWSSPGFLMQWKIALMEPFHCFARSNSSLVLTLLWLFLHLILFVFFSTSLQNTLQNWNG